MKHKKIILLISLQIVLILALILGIYKKLNNQVSVKPINRDFVAASSSSSLKYYYEFNPSSIMEDFVVGIPNKKVQYTINSDGLNESHLYNEKKDNSTYRIVTLGDSYTFGVFVDTVDNYPEQLKRLLNQLQCKKINLFEVINLGIDGYDIQYSVERFNLRGEKYDPDLILWLVKDDDFAQIQELTFPEIDRLMKEGVPGFEPETRDWPAYRIAVENSIKTYGEEKILELQRKNLALIRKYFGKKIVFINAIRNPKYISFLNDFIKLDKNSIILNMDNINNKELRFIDEHMNEKGNKVIAENVVNYLKKNLIACR